MANIIRDGIILMVYEFTIVILYIVLSDPIASVLSAIANAAIASGVTQITSYYNEIKTVFTIVFAGLGLIPIVWFIFRMFSREPDWGYRYE